MTHDDALAATIERVAQTLQLDNINAFDETIVPRERMLSYTAPEIIVSELPEFKLDPRDNTPADLLITNTIGEGGMGLVQLAKQVPLAREVAVKSLKTDAASSGKLRAILQEAWITGWLEHPNIVPIYTLGRNEQGVPLIVMKRIEGNAWTDYIHQPHKLQHTNKIYDLHWHLEILLQVCHAMEYAHDRGILHRDLKPENIMIGRFGEVYVLDWGIAVSLLHDLDGRLPLAEATHQPAGTPVYMAPESAMGDVVPDERLDVYLLGAILHELLTHKPPHEADSITAVLIRAATSAPKTYTEDIPTELASICNTAMHREREKRYQSVKAFRTAIEFYLEHKSSIDLSRQAQGALHQLKTLIEQDSPPAQIAASYGECLFGFKQALRIWSLNQDAHDGLVQCLTAKLQHDLHTDNLSAARVIVDELHTMDVHLPEQEHILDTKLKKQQQLQTIAREMDFSRGRRAKLAALIMLAILWSALPIVTGYREDSGTTLTHTGFIIGAVRVFTIAAVVIALFRKAMLINVANRRLALGLLSLTICMIAMRSVVALNNLPLQGMLAVEVVLYALFVAHLALTTNIRLMFGALGFLIGAILMSVFPAYDDYILGASNLTVMLFIITIWYTKKPSSTS